MLDYLCQLQSTDPFQLDAEEPLDLSGVERRHEPGQHQRMIESHVPQNRPTKRDARPRPTTAGGRAPDDGRDDDEEVEAVCEGMEVEL